MTKLHLLGAAFLLALLTLSITAPPARALQLGAVIAANAASGAFTLSPGIVTLYSGDGAPLTGFFATSFTFPLPTELAFTSVRFDGRPAPLYYVSPGQVNCYLDDALVGAARKLTVEVYGSLNHRGQPYYHKAEIEVNGGPGIFVQPDAARRPFAAGVATTDGVNYTPTATGAIEARGVLVLFGTSVRGVVSASADGINLPVLFSGAAPGFLGLDQLNLQLDNRLADRGWTPIRVIAGGRLANETLVNFR